jgi:hypothetical protein
MVYIQLYGGVQSQGLITPCIIQSSWMTILLKPTVTTGDSSNIQKDVEKSMVSFDNDLQMVGFPSFLYVFCMISGGYPFLFPTISSVLSLALELYVTSRSPC